MAEIKPIGEIFTPFKEKFGIPRQSGRAKSAQGKILFYPEFSDINAFCGLEKFSHIWIIFDFNKAHKDNYSPTVRPPRLGGNKRMGVFATRSPFRPNSLGLTVAQLIKIEKEKNAVAVYVKGIDILDGSPIYDIKPYIPYADAVFNAVGGFSDDEKDHKLNVVISSEISEKIPVEIKELLKECISDDPRPAYQNDERNYSLRIEDYDFLFFVKENTAYVKNFRKLK